MINMNKILISIALWILSKVDKSKIEFKNTWRYTLGELESFKDNCKPND